MSTLAEVVPLLCPIMLSMRFVLTISLGLLAIELCLLLGVLTHWVATLTVEWHYRRAS